MVLRICYIKKKKPHSQYDAPPPPPLSCPVVLSD